MTADQPLVTHEDLRVLRDLRSSTCDGDGGCAMDDCPGSGPHEDAALLDRLIAAAEADKPALPEGWVLLHFDDGARAVYFHKDGHLYVNDGLKGFALAFEVGETIDRDRLTPLVTAASLVPEGWFVEENGAGLPTIWDGQDSDLPLPLFDRGLPSEYAAFDVLAALVSAAQAERGESR